MPESQSICQECGTPLDTARTGGVCAACLLIGAVDGASAADAIGSIGGHELIEVIARGGMGIVYRARQTDPEREVALKALPGAELHSDEARQRFKIEAQAMARLDHPHILPVHEIGEEDGTPFFTMKLATGGTLAQRIGDYAGKWREIAELIATLAEAVQFAHSRGVLHRDLKPGNVLFGEDDTMYVSDFGLAKLIGTDTDLTRTLAMMGTPNYMAPEMAHKNGGVTTASDVWSLGVMLYELLAGHVPFQGENIPAVLRAVAEDEPTSLVGRLCETASPASHRDALQQRRLAETAQAERRLTETPYKAIIPRDLAVITFKALAKDPARRYVTAQELADDLRRWLAGEPIHARPVPLVERAWLWAKRKPALAASLAILALTLLGSAALLVRSNNILRARDAELREVDAQRRGEIHRALLEKADAERLSMTPGRRGRALNLVREALAHGISTQARSVAASAMAVQDVRVTQTWPIGRLRVSASPMTFTPDLAYHVAIVPAAQVRDPAWTEGALGLWRTADHALLKQIPITKRFDLGYPSLSPDARWLCVCISRKHLEIWDLQSEQRLTSFSSSSLPQAAFHPTDGTLIALFDGELRRIHLPDLRQESLARDFTGPPQLTISPDGKLVAVGQNRDLDGITPLYRLEARSLADGARVYSSPVYVWGDLAWTPDSSALAVFDRNSNALYLHDIRAGGKDLPRELARSASTGRRVGIWPDGRTLGWVDNAGFLHLHDLWLGKEAQVIPATAMALTVSADGTRFAFTPTSNTAAVGELLPAPILRQQKSTFAEMSVDRELVCSPDGRWLATAHHQGITLWQAEPLRPVAHRLAHVPYQTVENLHFSADSSQLRFHSNTTRRTVWDIVEGNDSAATLSGPDASGPKSDHILNAASLNGCWECSTSFSEKSSHFYLWRDGAVIGTFQRELNPYRVDQHSRLLSPDGQWGAWGCMAQEHAEKPGFTYIIHFDRDNHRTILSWEASHTELAISADSRWLVGGESSDYVIWDSTTWQPAFRLPAALSDSVPGSAAFSPDGTLLALEVEHGKIRLLRCGSWEEVLTITPPQAIPIERMAFSPDGKHLYTTGGQILHRWDVAQLKEELETMGIGW